jgi:hypothetical protein
MRSHYRFMGRLAGWNKGERISVGLFFVTTILPVYVRQNRRTCPLRRLTWKKKKVGRLTHSIRVLLSTSSFAHPEPSVTNSFHRFAHPRISNKILRARARISVSPGSSTSPFIFPFAPASPCSEGDLSLRGDCTRPESHRLRFGLDGVGEEGLMDPWRSCLNFLGVLGVLRGGKGGCGDDATG